MVNKSTKLRLDPSGGPSITTQDQYGTVQRLSIGVIGLGMAGGVMISAILEDSSLHLVGACDLNMELRTRFTDQLGLPAFDSIKELLELEGLDAVYIATPHQLHVQHAEQVLAAGKHCVVEKPMAMSLVDCDAMVHAANEAGKCLLIGHTHSYDPTICAAKELISTGSIGTVRSITALNFTDFIYRPRRPDELDPKKGGGVVWNQIPHQLDMILQLLQDTPIAVSAQVDILDESRPVTGLVNAQIRFARGATASIHYSGYDRFDSDEWYEGISEIGAKKTISHGRTARASQSISDEQMQRSVTMGFGGNAFSDLAMRGHPHFGELIIVSDQADIRFVPEGLRIYRHAGLETKTIERPYRWGGQVAVWKTLCEAINANLSANQTTHIARLGVELCLAIEASNEHGKEIRLDT